ncbi:MAG: SPOR domain-containing protein [Gammaproteobacteria bacterium]|nr:SPOR domain-containing protein [Gammaproteobacteria bacterium]
MVRTGTFRKAANAPRMREAIRGRGFEAWVEEGGGDLAWRVWVGSFASQAEAADALRKLCAAGGGECDYYLDRRR